MIYRKAAVRPARLLLRVVKVTSAAALAAACGGVVDSTGLVGGGLYCSNEPGATPCDGTSDAGAGGGLVGSLGVVDSGPNPCANGCGLVPSYDDGGDADADEADADEADADEADAPTGGGLVVDPDAGEGDASTVIIGVLPHP